MTRTQEQLNQWKLQDILDAKIHRIDLLAADNAAPEWAGFSRRLSAELSQADLADLMGNL
jgi:hypothetical protein